MMALARKRQIHLDTTPYYHCMSRCVRRAFLCGNDPVTKKNYDHRKQWLVDRIKELGNIFAIDICAYAVLSNHYHVILHINKSKAHQWDNFEIAKRWVKLFKGNELANRWVNGEILDPLEYQHLNDKIALWGQRLTDISWFMRCLNEPIARESNREDRCTGHFWEGRFKSQALLDEVALLTCMAYVDLNPIRAGLANDLMKSDFTSIQERLLDYQKTHNNRHHDTKQTAHVSNTSTKDALLPFMENERSEASLIGIPFSLKEYIQLLDWTGRAVRTDKKGAIPENIAPILTVLSINRKEWLANVKYFGHRFPKVAGSIDKIKDYCQRFNQRYALGQAFSQKLYQSR